MAMGFHVKMGVNYPCFTSSAQISNIDPIHLCGCFFSFEQFSQTWTHLGTSQVQNHTWKLGHWHWIHLICKASWSRISIPGNVSFWIVETLVIPYIFPLCKYNRMRLAHFLVACTEVWSWTIFCRKNLFLPSLISGKKTSCLPSIGCLSRSLGTRLRYVWCLLVFL